MGDCPAKSDNHLGYGWLHTCILEQLTLYPWGIGLIGCVNRDMIEIDEIKETIEASNDSLVDDNEEVYSNKANETSKDIGSFPVCFISSYPL